MRRLVAEVKRGLRQEYVMSPWLFNIFFDRVVRPVNDRTMSRGVKLIEIKREVAKLSNYYMMMTGWCCQKHESISKVL